MARIRRSGSSAALVWPAHVPGHAGFRCRLGTLPVPAPVLDDDAAARLLGTAWEPAEQLLDDAGIHVGSIWRTADGSVFLPFDPEVAIRTLWSEAYVTDPWRSRARGLARAGYYRLKPLLPRSTQIAARRAFSRIQARSAFPRWPAETALHDLYDFLFAELAGISDEPVPFISPWPAGRAWALVLTHDVETRAGYRNLHLLRDVELELGFRSSWNFVPKRDYDVDDTVVAGLREMGFEVGVHGLRHDGRDLESRSTLLARLPEIELTARRWGAVGFRSPSTQRRWEWMSLLPFDYDSSSPDTDPFEPQGGGCCSWLPFFNERLVELPITLPQDHTLFVILRRADESDWIAKTTVIRNRGGMALLNAHPDYLLEPAKVELYRRFLRAFADDGSAWRALPREVAAWWRRRAATTIEPDGPGWRLSGPAAAEGSIELVAPS